MKTIKYGYDENGKSIPFDILETEMQYLFISRVKQVLTERGWNQKRLAEALGVLPSSLQMNPNKSMPSIKLMMRYAEVLGVEVWDLIYDCGVSNVGIEGKAVSLKWHSQDDLNQRISTMMRSRGLTQQYVADQLGITRVAVTSNLQSNNMPLKILLRIAKVMGVEPWELLIDREDMERDVARRRNGGKEVKSTEVKSAAKQSWDDATPELFIERVKALLGERSWTRKQLADMLGVGVTGLILDKKKAFPSISVMQKYADVFGVQVWEMIYDCGVPAFGVKGNSEPLKWQTQEELENCRLDA